MLPTDEKYRTTCFLSLESADMLLETVNEKLATWAAEADMAYIPLAKTAFGNWICRAFQ